MKRFKVVVWDGEVEVFLVRNHLTAKKAYAWSYKDNDGKTQYAAVLGISPINSAIDAVRAYAVAQRQKQN